MSKLLESVKDINKTIVEIKDIVELGESGKESLLFFMQTNIDKLTTKFPNLSLKIT